MLAGDSRQPHLTLVMGWRVGVDVVVVVKGTRTRTRTRPEGEQRILFSSTQQPGDEPAGEDCVCRLEPGDETGALEGVEGGVGGLQTWECQLPDSSPCATHVSQHLLFYYAKPPSPLR